MTIHLLMCIVADHLVGDDDLVFAATNLATAAGLCRLPGETVRPLPDRRPSGLQAASILALRKSALPLTRLDGA
jgi:hypothetical protein